MQSPIARRAAAIAAAMAATLVLAAPPAALADGHAVEPIPANARALAPFVSVRITGAMINRADADNDGFIDGKELRTLRRKALDKLLDDD